MQQQANAMQMFLPLAIFVVVFYFFIMRPQKKRQKAMQNMLNSLERGDRVITAGGFFGTIRELKDDSLILEIADGIRVRILKSSISTRVPSEEPAKESVPAEEEAK